MRWPAAVVVLSVAMLLHSSAHGVKVCVLAPCPGTDLLNSCPAVAGAALAAQHIRDGNGSVVGAELAARAASSEALTNVELVVRDSEGHPGVGVAVFVEGLRDECAVVVGAARSSVSSPVSVVAAASDQALLSFASTASALSEPSLYPLFARTIPADDGNADTVIDLVKHFGWQAIGVFARNDAWGIGLQQALQARAATSDIRVTPALFDDEIAESIDGGLDVLLDAGVRIIVVATSTGAADDVFYAAEQRGMMGGDGAAPYVWISIESQPARMLQRAEDPARLGPLLQGMLVVAPTLPESPEYAALVAAWSEQSVDDPAYEAVDFGGDDVFAAAPSFFYPFAYDAMWLAALALDAAHAEAGGGAAGDAAIGSGAAVHAQLTPITFAGASGTVSLTPGGNRDPGTVTYSVHNVVDDSAGQRLVATRDGANGIVEHAEVAWPGGLATTPSDGVSCSPRFQFSPYLGHCVPRIGVLFRSKGADGAPLAEWRRQASLLGAMAIEHVNARNIVGAPALSAPGALHPTLAIEPVFGETFQAARMTTQAVLDMIALHGGVAAIAGYSRSSTSRAATNVAAAFEVPYLSASATASSLSSPDDFPWFVRTVPPDSMVAAGMAHVVASLSLRRVAFVGEADEYGFGFASDFTRAADTLGIEVANVYHYGPKLSVEAATRLAAANNARVYVLIGQDPDIARVLATLEQLGVTGEGYAFFVGDATSPQIASVEGASSRTNALAQGLIRVQPAVSPNPGLEALQQAWAASDANTYQQRYPELLLPDDVFDTPFPNAGALFYDAVLAAVLAVNASLQDEGSDLAPGVKIMERLLETQFEGASGTVALDPVTGDRSFETVTIGIDNFVLNDDGSLVSSPVGLWSATSGVQLTTAITWPGDTLNRPNDGICGDGEVFVKETSLCEACPPGTAFDTDLFSCVPCSVGRFAPERGMSDCVSCDSVGGYANVNGSSRCSPCPAGTARTVGSAAVDVSECVCKENYYTLDGPGVACSVCPEGAVCPGGALPPYPLPGHWSASSMPSLALPCHAVDADDCVGGSNYSCAVGTRGRMCAECEEGYYSFGIDCYECPPEGSAARWVVTYGGIAGVVLLWIVVNAAAGNQDVLDLALLLAQIINHVQYFRLQWPDSLRFITVVFTFLNFDVGFLTPKCEVPSWTFLHSYGLQFMLPLLWAAVSLLLTGFAWLHMRAYRARDKDGRPRYPAQARALRWCVPCLHQPRTRRGFRETVDGHIRRNLVLVIVIYNTLSKQAFDAFVCVELPDGTSFVSFIPDVTCGSGRHSEMTAISVLAVIVYVIGIPLSVYFILWHGRKHNLLRDERYLRRYGQLYRRYSPSVLGYYEVVLLARRAGISIVLAVFQRQPYKQVLAGIVVMTLALVVHFKLMPFNRRTANLVDGLSIGVTLFYIVCGALFEAGVDFADELAVIVEFAVWGAVVVCACVTVRAELQRLQGRLAARLLETKVTTIAPALQEGHKSRVNQSRKLAIHHVESMHRELETRRDADVEAAAVDPPISSQDRETDIDSDDSHESDADSGYGELRLAESQLASVLRGPRMLRWVRRGDDDVAKMRRYVQVDTWLDPFVSEVSFASRYSNSASARLWREMLKPFPWLLDSVVDATEEELDRFAKVMSWLALEHRDMHNGRGHNSRFYPLVHNALLGPVALWFTLHANRLQRSTFRELLQDLLPRNRLAHHMQRRVSRAERAKARWQNALHAVQEGMRTQRSRSAELDSLDSSTSLFDKLSRSLRKSISLDSSEGDSDAVAISTKTRRRVLRAARASHQGWVRTRSRSASIAAPHLPTMAERASPLQRALDSDLFDPSLNPKLNLPEAMTVSPPRTAVLSAANPTKRPVALSDVVNTLREQHGIKMANLARPRDDGDGANEEKATGAPFPTTVEAADVEVELCSRSEDSAPDALGNGQGNGDGASRAGGAAAGWASDAGSNPGSDAGAAEEPGEDSRSMRESIASIAAEAGASDEDSGTERSRP